MADDDTKTGDDAPVTMGAVRKLVTDIVGSLIPGKKDDDTKDDDSSSGGSSITAQVDAALAALKRKEEKEARDAQVDEMLAERKKEPAKEKTPVERSRHHRFMGWGDPAE